MRKVLPRLLAAAAWLTSLQIAPTAGAYCRTTTCKGCPQKADGCPGGDVPVAWPSRCVSYSVAQAASAQVPYPEFKAAADKAFAAWRTASCPLGGTPSIEPSDAFGPAVCTYHEFNTTEPNANIISFREGAWPYPEGGTSTLALTNISFDGTTGEILDADIEINGTETISASDGVPVDAFDLQSILTHEAGHFLGLAHSQNAGATMWIRYQAGSDTFRKITFDDAAGICEIYPPGRSAGCKVIPVHGFSPYCSMPASQAGACTIGGTSRARPAPGVLALVVLTYWLGRRRSSERNARPEVQP